MTNTDPTDESATSQTTTIAQYNRQTEMTGIFYVENKLKQIGVTR